MKIEFPNPVHCCVCVNIGDQQRRAETIVAGYAVCTDHSVGLDEAGSLRAYIDRRRAAFTVAQCVRGCGRPAIAKGEPCGASGCR